MTGRPDSEYSVLGIASWAVLATIVVAGLLAAVASRMEGPLPGWLSSLLTINTVLFGLAALIAWITALRGIIHSHRDTEKKWLLFVLVLAGNFPGAVIYYFMTPSGASSHAAKSTRLS